MMAKIYILLPVHNRKEITRDFIRCLKTQTFTDYHLLLIDDGSTDGTADMVKENIPSATVLQGTGNWWWAGSLQRGLEWLREHDVDDSALVLCINDDVRFVPDYLESAMRVMKEKEHVLMLSKFAAADNGEVQETGVYADCKWLAFSPPKPGQQINCLSTRGLFMHWKDVKEIGDFHPRLLPHYGSDYEYTMRAFRKGIACETSDELLILPNHATTGFHTLENSGLCDLVRKLFSKRSPNNPVYRSAFVFLVVPPLWILPNLVKVWVQTLRIIAGSVLKRNYVRKSGN